ncbi:ABC transporter permease subunit [Halobacterium yunchengense]|uniref:ABC transporter permease subunit n=1 Tax=Halobacterium yunchengense TaxID=3108497 RepID=UPI00300B1D84
MRRHERTFVVADRELRTVVRNRALLAVAAAFFAAVVGLGGASTGSPGGYVSLTYNLLVPVAVLVPVLAFAFGYQSVRGDAARGEVDVIRTYPVSRAEYALGVFVGRALAVLAVVVASLAVAGVVASTGAEQPASFLATHSAGDTLAVYARFVLFAVGYALAVVALVLAASAVSRSDREALAVTAGVVVVVVFVLDLALVTLLSMGFLTADSVAAFLAVGPSSAFRGLVFELAVRPALATPLPVRTAAPALSAAGLLAWWAVGVGVTALAAWPAGDE